MRYRTRNTSSSNTTTATLTKEELPPESPSATNCKVEFISFDDISREQFGDIYRNPIDGLFYFHCNHCNVEFNAETIDEHIESLYGITIPEIKLEPEDEEYGVDGSGADGGGARGNDNNNHFLEQNNLDLKNDEIIDEDLRNKSGDIFCDPITGEIQFICSHCGISFCENAIDEHINSINDYNIGLTKLKEENPIQLQEHHPYHHNYQNQHSHHNYHQRNVNFENDDDFSWPETKEQIEGFHKESVDLNYDDQSDGDGDLNFGNDDYDDEDEDGDYNEVDGDDDEDDDDEDDDDDDGDEDDNDDDGDEDDDDDGAENDEDYVNVDQPENGNKIEKLKKLTIVGNKKEKHLSSKKSKRKRSNKTKPIQCGFCSKSFICHGLKDTHELEHDDTIRSHQCKICPAKFKSKTLRSVHAKDVHSIEVTVFTCKYCFYAFNNQMRLDRHQSVRQNCGERVDGENIEVNKLKPRKRGVRCPACPMVFKTMRAKQAHFLTHGERPFKCTECDYTCRRQITYQAHIVLHTGVAPYLCDICGKGLPHACHFNAHMRTHSGEKPYHCNVCKEDFACSWQLSRHVTKMHSGPLPEFICDFCGKSFLVPRRLAEHRRIHTGEKPYQCEHCVKSFPRQSEYRLHIRLHQGDRPFACRFCEIRFRHGTARKVHEREIHGKGVDPDAEPVIKRPRGRPKNMAKIEAREKKKQEREAILEAKREKRRAKDEKKRARQEKKAQKCDVKEKIIKKKKNDVNGNCGGGGSSGINISELSNNSVSTLSNHAAILSQSSVTSPGAITTTHLSSSITTPPPTQPPAPPSSLSSALVSGHFMPSSIKQEDSVSGSGDIMPLSLLHHQLQQQHLQLQQQQQQQQQLHQQQHQHQQQQQQQQHQTQHQQQQQPHQHNHPSHLTPHIPPPPPPHQPSFPHYPSLMMDPNTQQLFNLYGGSAHHAIHHQWNTHK